MQKPIYITFASPKGGVGKTTLTTLMASYLHYTKEYQCSGDRLLLSRIRLRLLASK